NATSLSSVLKLNMQSPYSLSGYLKFSQRGYTYSVGDLPVFVIHHEEDLQRLVQREEIEGILFVHQRDILTERNRLIPYCMTHHLQMFTVPPIGKWKSEMPQVRSLDISDLLGREEIRISTEKIAADLKDKVVLVTGAAGSIGSELCRQIAQFEVSTLILFDNCETGVHNLRLELEENFPNLKLAPTVGDVRSRKRLEYIFGKYKPQIVFHAAAYKHVPLMELNPNEAFMVNVKGTRNVAHTALKFDVEKFVMVSTDKAVNPTNVMGASKRLAEIYVQSLDHALKTGKREGNTRYITTRFGNVLGSQGSVIPRFQEQIAKGGPLTVTHPEITRYFMTIREACLLVLEASNIGKGGEIMVFDMGTPVKIADLAKKMIQLSGHSLEDIKIEYTGLRPGEKLYEEVLNSEEHTQPTSHRKIRIADARTYEFDEVVAEFDTLID
ncbi:MAG: polysaccharide biosynthesis protein, partial [Bacteroidales bacterium]|nr:polysaccharide biosynthesis protein [Bacteroidales bacterium]